MPRGLSVLFFLLTAASSSGQGTVTTIAGTGGSFVFPEHPIDAKSAPLGPISYLTLDSAGNLFAIDKGNERVVKIAPDGILTSIWQNSYPAQLAADTAGNVYVLYAAPSLLFTYIDKIEPSGKTTRLDLNTTFFPNGITTDTKGNFYFIDSTASVVRIAPDGTKTKLPVLVYPTIRYVGAMAVDSLGNFYFSGSNPLGSANGPVRIWKATPTGVFSVFAGTNTSGYSGDNGPATQAELNLPQEFALDGAGNMYIADSANNRTRKISAAGVITTFAGSGKAGDNGDGGSALKAELSYPEAVAVDIQGNVYVGDTANDRVRKIDPAGTITNFAGNEQLFIVGNNGPAVQAALSGPRDIVADPDGNLFFTEANDRVRKISTDGIISVFAGRKNGFLQDGNPMPVTDLSNPQGLAIDAQRNLYVADSGFGRIRKIAPDGTLTTVAGGGPNAFCDNCRAVDVGLSGPTGVAVDGAGNLYIAEAFFCSIDKVDAAGRIFRILRLPAYPLCTAPIRVAVDAAGNLYASFASTAPGGTDGFVARIGPDGAISKIVQGVPSAAGMAFDANGTLYVALASPPEVIRVDPGGVITRVAGTGQPPTFLGDGGPANRASLITPEGIAFDADGFMYITDRGNGRIRRVVGPSCTGLAEPSMALNVPAGFYIATVRNTAGSRDGYWGLSAVLGGTPDKSYLPGGVNIGGAILGNDALPAYGAFFLPFSQDIGVSIAAQALSSGGTLGVRARLLNAQRQPVGAEESGITSIAFQRSLDTGFYILEVYSGANSPALTFQASILAPIIASALNAGGYVSKNSVAYIAFYVPFEQSVNFSSVGPSNGKNGAGCLQLQLFDSDRNLLQSAP